MTNKPLTQTVIRQADVGSAQLRSAERIAVAGSILGALAASSCCIAPLMLFSLGISGAWIGNLTRLAPYQPYSLAATAACLGYGYWLVYRSRQRACAPDKSCARPLPSRLAMSGLFVATVLVVAAIGFNLLAPFLLSS